MTKVTETTGLDVSRKLLEEMGFEQVQHILPELLEQAVKDNTSFSGFLERLLRKEREYREERRIKTSLKLSGLPCGKTLENFDFTFQRSVGKKEIELLATCEYVRRKENVLLLGPPGVGKSHLAAALGVKAVQNGFSVSWLPADDLLQRLRRDEENPSRRNKRRKYLSCGVLVIDELGFQTLDRSDAHLLFKVVSARYERSSTIITSNKSIREWPKDACRRRGAHHGYPGPAAPSLPRGPCGRQQLQALGDGAKNPAEPAKGGVTETGKIIHRVQGFRKWMKT
jgi:DNA replication protein DnaC